MKANDVSIAVYSSELEALKNARIMESNGFEVSPVLEVSYAISWNNFTVQPQKLDDANVPAWLVIGRR
jgi:hypothetical protein